MKTENIIVFVLVIAVVVLSYLYFSGKCPLSTLSSKTLSPQKAGEAALSFINEYMLEKGNEAQLLGEVTKERGLYKFTIKLGEQEISSYITQDGAMLFPQGGVDLEKVKEELSTKSTKGPKAEPALKTCSDLNIEKREAPLLEAFVVSYCPFGLQMQRVLQEIVKGIPELKENIKIRYMGQVQDGKIVAMHGEKEAQENLKQICLREEQPEKFYGYLECFMKEGKTEECLTSANIDKTTLDSCLQEPSKGVKYAKEDFALQDAYGVTGSPSLFLNGQKVSEFDFGGRSAQAVKDLLCCGFNSEAGVCSKVLSEEQAATSFSETYTGSSSSGSCN